MTRTEQAELNELHITPEQLEERRREVEAKLHAAPNGIEPARRRKPRSDRGISKGPKLVKQAPTAAGVLSDAQAAELRGLAEKMVATAKDLADAQRRNLQAAVDYFAYLDSLTAKN